MRAPRNSVRVSRPQLNNSCEGNHVKRSMSAYQYPGKSDHRHLHSYWRSSLTALALAPQPVSLTPGDRWLLGRRVVVIGHRWRRWVEAVVGISLEVLWAHGFLLTELVFSSFIVSLHSVRCLLADVILTSLHYLCL